MSMSVYVMRKKDREMEFNEDWGSGSGESDGEYLGPCCKEDDFILDEYSPLVYELYASGEGDTSADEAIKYFKLSVRIKIKLFVKRCGGELKDFVVTF